MPEIRQSDLHQLFEYLPDGTLRRKTANKRSRRGAIVGEKNDGTDYLQTTVNGLRCQVHLAVWLMHYGKMPTGFVDHRNGNKRDNRIENLRDSSRQQNNQNRSVGTNNKVGVKGVHWDKTLCKWRSVIYLNGRKEFSAYFETLLDAVAAIFSARSQLHGEFARHR
jgi:hypothetical protein